MLPRPGRHQPPKALCTRVSRGLPGPTPRDPASHALLIQLLSNPARHVFQNPDAPRHHFQLLILLTHDQLQIG